MVILLSFLLAGYVLLLFGGSNVKSDVILLFMALQNTTFVLLDLIFYCRENLFLWKYTLQGYRQLNLVMSGKKKRLRELHQGVSLLKLMLMCHEQER